MGNLSSRIQLRKGAALGAQIGLVDFFREVHTILDNLEASTPLKIHRSNSGRWTIELESAALAGVSIVLDEVSVEYAPVEPDPDTGVTPPAPVQVYKFDAPSSAAIPEPEEPEDGATALDGMDEFQLLVRRVNPVDSVAKVAYLDKAVLAKILGARTEKVLTIAANEDGSYALKAREVLVFSSDAPDVPIELTLEKRKLVTGVEWDSPDLKQKAVSAFVVSPAAASGTDVATGTDETVTTFVGHSTL